MTAILGLDLSAIYALVDPRTNQVRYIGKSVNPRKRLRGHCTFELKHNTRRTAWIKSLLTEHHARLQAGRWSRP